jgi:hypothetical protein
MISQAHRCMVESLGIYFSPGILAFTLETQKLTRIEYIAILKRKSQLETFLLVHPLKPQQARG